MDRSKVFVVFSATEKGGRKRIQNPEVIQEIRSEIERLGGPMATEA